LPTQDEPSHSPLPDADSGGRPGSWRWPGQPIDFTGISRVLKLLLNDRKNLRLRTKLLSSLVLSITALTCATLLVVRHSAQLQVRRQIDQDARNALLTIQAVQHQREMVLSRKCDMLATLAYIRGGDATTIQQASEDPWQRGDCDLFALTNSNNKNEAFGTNR